MNEIQGFVLESSEDLVVLQYVYDFRLDGLMILSRSDITGVRETKTDKFQTRLLKHEGLFEKVPFGRGFEAGNWRSIIKQLSRSYSLLIIECERGNDPDFVIGRLLKATSAAAYVQHFTGVGQWLEEPVRVAYKEISCVQVGSNYLNVYQRHFECHVL
ncbi:hypothetical protein [Ideonella sp. B508-1]|uniref:hypothetical protein n=1 Tax=Ideonella sp. B508-1 TaxID=137716 RepID=UPI0011D26EC7|nr:hypothetical protein [Ideonella sp. B508-1]